MPGYVLIAVVLALLAIIGAIYLYSSSQITLYQGNADKCRQDSDTSKALADNYKSFFLLDPSRNGFTITQQFTGVVTGMISNNDHDALTVKVDETQVTVFLVNTTYIYNCNGNLDVQNPYSSSQCLFIKPSRDMITGKKARVTAVLPLNERNYKATLVIY